MKKLFSILAIVLILAIAGQAQGYRVYPVNWAAATALEVPAGSELINFIAFGIDGRSFPGVQFKITAATETELWILWHGPKEIRPAAELEGKRRRRVECGYVSYYLDPLDLSNVYAGPGCGYFYR